VVLHDVGELEVVPQLLHRQPMQQREVMDDGNTEKMRGAVARGRVLARRPRLPAVVEAESLRGGAGGSRRRLAIRQGLNTPPACR
jgi:hypothetical protein